MEKEEIDTFIEKLEKGDTKILTVFRKEYDDFVKQKYPNFYKKETGRKKNK